MEAQVISSVLSATTVLILGVIGRGVVGVRREIRQWRQEHAYLLRSMTLVLRKLDLDGTPAPNGVPSKRHTSWT